MLSYSLLITLLGLTNAAPMRLPMPHTHRRDTLAPPFAPRSFQDERPRLLDLDLGLGLDSVLPNLDLDLGLGLDLAPILDVDLGISLDLEVGGWLTCNSVNGAFGGRRYDLGCTCIGSSGDLLLDVDVDVDALVNAQGLDVWVKSQVQLGLGFYYPSGARPICDGNGGWTCPGNCGGSSSQPPSISTALSQSRPAPTSSSTSASVTSTPTAISTSSAAPTSTSFVVQDVPSSSIWTSSSTQSTWAPSSFSTWKASSWVPISSWAAVSSWAPSSTWTPSSTSDSHISAQNTQIPGQSYGYTPPVATTTVTPTKTEAAWTVYEGATTMTLPTVFMVDHTETVTLTKTITVTEKSAPQATVTVTETVHDGECFTEESVPISTSWIPSTTSTPSSTWSTQSSPWTSSITPTSSTWMTASALAQTLPPPSSTFSWTPSPTPTVGIVDDCPKGQKFDITLQICLDICLGLGVLDDAGLCVDLDTGLGVDLPILGPIVGSAKDVLGNNVLAGLGGVGPGGVGSLGELGGLGGLGGLL